MKKKSTVPNSLMPRFTMLLVALIVSLGFPCVPAAAEQFKDKVYETTLASGLKVILLENHKAPVVSLQVWYRVGSRNEPWGKTGLSHLLEHMMFKGGKRFTAEEFVRTIQENGGNSNAFTSRDYTAYFVNISADRVAIPLEFEADRMGSAQFDEQGLATEQKVVIEERRLRTVDNPHSHLYEQVFATAYQVHPYHWPIIGWMEDLERITLADVKEYYNRYYKPTNAFLVVVGDFNRQELLPLIEKAFGQLPPGQPPNQGVSREPRQLGERRITIKREGAVPALMMGYHVPNLSKPDSYILEVIKAVLTRGRSSRLYERLVRTERAAIAVEADNPLKSRDPGLFFVSVEALPGKDLKELEKAVDEEIARLHRELVSFDELQKAKNQLESAFVYGQDSVFYQAMVLAQYEIGSTWKAVDRYLPSIRRVTADDIQRVARQYLVPDNRTVGTFIPLPLGDDTAQLPNAQITASRSKG